MFTAGIIGALGLALFFAALVTDDPRDR